MSSISVNQPGVARIRLFNSAGVLTSDKSLSVPGANIFSEVRNPDRVRSRKPTGWLFPKAYSLSVTSTRMPSGTLKMSPVNNGLTEYTQEIYGSSATTAAPLLPDSANMLRKVEIEALLKLKDQRINLGVAMAEAQQTANLVGTTATRLAKAYTAAKDGNWKRAGRALGTSWKKTPKNWLEAQYAWLPLLSDVKGSIDALTRQEVHSWITTVKSVDEEVEKSTRDFVSTNGGLRAALVQRRGWFVRLDYLPTNQFLSTLTSVGVTNPLEIIWEKVPFSFVVDWFVPIGDWLSAMDATLGYQFYSGSKTSRRETVTKVGLSDSPLIMAGSRVSGRSKVLSLNRTPYGSSPLPYLPRVKDPFSLGHVANGLSLLAAAFSHK